MTTTRRVFLQVVGAGAGAMCVGGLAGCAAVPNGPIAAGNVSDLAVGAVKQVAGAGVLVGRDAAGVYGMTSICTHLGCDMSGADGTIAADNSINCGCHGSVFKADGTVLTGPASAPLQHWKTTVAADGAISVEVGTEAKAEDRAPVTA